MLLGYKQAGEPRIAINKMQAEQPPGSRGFIASATQPQTQTLPLSLDRPAALDRR